MQLNFAQNSDEGRAAAGWADQWLALENQAGGEHPPARFLSVWSGPDVHGFDSPARLGGVMVHPAPVILGIRAWNDAHEGGFEPENAAQSIPFVLFDIEKIVRMMLHQSGMAFEILASPARLEVGGLGEERFPARDIINAAISCDMLHYYWDISTGAMARMVESNGQGAGLVDVLDAVRHALTGVFLSRGEVEFRLPRLLEGCADAELVAHVDALRAEGLKPDLLSAIQARITAMIAEIDPQRTALPSGPTGYDWLNDLVVDWRQREAAR